MEAPEPQAHREQRELEPRAKRAIPEQQGQAVQAVHQ
jgi:hypothetical protein